MKRLLTALRNSFLLLLNLPKISNSKFVLIEDSVFGHGIFGHAMVESMSPLKYPNSVYLITNKNKANPFYSSMVITRALSRGFKVDENITRAFHGNLFLSKRFRISSFFNFLNTSQECTHRDIVQFGTITNFTEFKALPIELQKREYVTVMNRSEVYRKIGENPQVHDHRNFRFEKIGHALDTLKNDEYKFVRIGEYSEHDLIHSSVLDFRREVSSNKQLDVIVQEHAVGYFGADSGPVWIPMSRGKPVGLIDVIPLGHPFPIEPQRVLCLTKQIYNHRENRFLTISELSNNFITSLLSLEDYKEQYLEVFENSEDEVRDFLRFWIHNILQPNHDAILSINSYMRSIRRAISNPFLPSIYIPKYL